MKTRYFFCSLPEICTVNEIQNRSLAKLTENKFIVNITKSQLKFEYKL